MQKIEKLKYYFVSLLKKLSAVKVLLNLSMLCQSVSSVAVGDGCCCKITIRRR